MVDTGSDNILKAKLSLLKGLLFSKLLTLQWLSFQGKGTTFCFSQPGGLEATSPGAAGAPGAALGVERAVHTTLMTENPNQEPWRQHRC